MTDYTKKTWVDYPNTTTPITASELNVREQALYDLTKQKLDVNEAQNLSNTKKKIARDNIDAAKKYYPAVEGNIVTLTADGDIDDSGIPIDNIPTLWATTEDINEGDPVIPGVFYAVYDEPTQ